MQGVPAGSATPFVQEALKGRRMALGQHSTEALAGPVSAVTGGVMAELEALGQGVGSRRRVQQVTGDASVLLSLDPLPSAPVFVPSGPRSVSCDTSKVRSTLVVQLLY